MPVSAQPGAVKPGLNQHVDHPVVGGGGGEGREPGGVCALATVPRLQPPNSGCVRLSRRLPGPRCISCQQVCSRRCQPQSSHPDRSLYSSVTVHSIHTTAEYPYYHSLTRCRPCSPPSSPRCSPNPRWPAMGPSTAAFSPIYRV